MVKSEVLVEGFGMWYGEGVMDDVQLLEVEMGSGEYEELLGLRFEELRAPLGLEWSKEELKWDEMERHFGLYLGDEVVGVMVVRELDGGVVKLRQIATARRVQGQGYGRQLMELVEGQLTGEGVCGFELHSRMEVAGFYEKLGYEPEGGVFEEIGIPHVKMRKELS